MGADGPRRPAGDDVPPGRRDPRRRLRGGPAVCGMTGTIGVPRKAFDVSAALELIAHRGPDGSGVREDGPAVHGHVRLALLDLTDASAQPFRRGGGTLSFVGEIWNHRELREWMRAE